MEAGACTPGHCLLQKRGGSAGSHHPCLPLPSALPSLSPNLAWDLGGTHGPSPRPPLHENATPKALRPGLTGGSPGHPGWAASVLR